MLSSSRISGLQTTASTYRIIGVGNAGVNFLDRLLLSAPSFTGLIALNNDAEALAASVVTTQICLPSDVEYDSNFSVDDLAKAAPQLVDEIALASVVILVGGLGGSFASRLLPHVAMMSKLSKKTTLACLSLPFSFEGKRTQFIATQSIAALEKECNGMMLLDNDRLCAKKASISALGETFAASDEAMEAVIPALLAILFNKGPVRITRAHFLKAMQHTASKSCFGYGYAQGANRLHEALERALKNPLLDRGRCFAKARDIFLLLRGPKDISFAEAQAAMQEIERLAGADRDIQLSVYPEEAIGAPLQVFLLAIIKESTPATKRVEPPLQTNSVDPLPDFNSRETPSDAALEQARDSREGDLIIQELPSDVSEYASSALERENDISSTTQALASLLVDPMKEKAKKDIKEFFPELVYHPLIGDPDDKGSKSSTSSTTRQTQGALNLKTFVRGRFDKSEPTIFEGEDLDTPTYLRLGIKLN